MNAIIIICLTLCYGYTLKAFHRERQMQILRRDIIDDVINNLGPCPECGFSVWWNPEADPRPKTD